MFKIVTLHNLLKNVAVSIGKKEDISLARQTMSLFAQPRVRRLQRTRRPPPTLPQSVLDLEAKLFGTRATIHRRPGSLFGTSTSRSPQKLRDLPPSINRLKDGVSGASTSTKPCPGRSSQLKTVVSSSGHTGPVFGSTYQSPNELHWKRNFGTRVKGISGKYNDTRGPKSGLKQSLSGLEDLEDDWEDEYESDDTTLHRGRYFPRVWNETGANYKHDQAGGGRSGCKRSLWNEDLVDEWPDDDGDNTIFHRFRRQPRGLGTHRKY